MPPFDNNIFLLSGYVFGKILFELSKILDYDMMNGLFQNI